MARFITQEKLTKLYDSLEAHELDFLFISDSEAHRDVNVKYLTGHPEEAGLFVDIKNRQTTLIPWDYQLAKMISEADEIVDVADYHGVISAATIDFFEKRTSSNPKVGIPRGIPYDKVQVLLDAIPNTEIIFNPKIIDNLLAELRATKSDYEISLMQKSVDISNQLVKEIEEIMISRSRVKTEMDLAVFVESRMRELGAFAVGFESLVASSARSWQIHTYPRADPKQSLYQKGLALIDFGVQADALTSDVTLPFIMGPMNSKMKTIVDTVKLAHDAAIDALSDAEYLHEVADVAVNIIEGQGYRMPHSLGHGIGLTVHDSPVLRKKPTNESMLKHWTPSPIEEGMIITIEPGIYEKDVGGFRLENDVLITRNRPKVLTNSEPIFIDLI
ncbi:hypothetical protein CEE45_06660 [Candidatus Heimdallarchaeota archaeon B3_Heim]|nr:MAG: hypothetical protein CEE45_06660 [Candidatus Heimdallarchaeota archaeon B3_Heim]